MLEQSRTRFSVRVEPAAAPALPRQRQWTAPPFPAKAGRTRRWGVFVVASATALLCALAFAFAVTRPARTDAASARTELGQSLGLLKLGNISAARAHAQAAIKADPDWGLAHAVMARIFLALGDGVAAEGELGRAQATGFDIERAHQLYAHAWLLQGDAKRALAEAARAKPLYAGYAARGRRACARGTGRSARRAADALHRPGRGAERQRSLVRSRPGPLQ